jgi:L-lactate dehydrogenase complex protein LldG
MRNEMLARIRGALGRRVGDPVAPAPAVRLESSPGGDLTARFRSALTALGGSVIEAAGLTEAKACLEKLLEGKTFVSSGAGLLQSLGIGRRFSRVECASAEFGITSAEYALADTGTLVLGSERGESRLVSLLPPHHIAVVERAKILTSLDEWLSIVPHPADRASATVLVTGPSRTADIEMRLVRGVHGPGEISVVVVG